MDPAAMERPETPQGIVRGCTGNGQPDPRFRLNWKRGSLRRKRLEMYRKAGRRRPEGLKMNKWILSGGLAAFLAAGLPWTASYGAPYAPGDPSFSEQWAFYNDGTFSIEEEKNRYAVYDDPLWTAMGARGLAL